MKEITKGKERRYETPTSPFIATKSGNETWHEAMSVPDTESIVTELKHITKELKRHNEKMDWLEQAISRLANNL